MLLPHGLRSRKLAWSVYLPMFFVVVAVTLGSYQQPPKFPRAGIHDEGQLRKTELKLYEVVIGTMFRPLFYGIVQPKVLLSFGSSSLVFPSIGEI